ncbi:MAG: Spy/CpxP family protein refolding chaperone, partial [Rhodocyclaceae bacterium]|nr:Spy/CpxP family protein refolding chaperone [Rhodocyclaceae bacterium]
MKRPPWILAGLISAGIASISFAQPGSGMMPGCDGMGPMGRPAAMRFDPAERAGRHLDFLKSQLKLTPEQEPLWQAYAEKVQAEAGKARPAWRAQAAEEKLTAPERMAKMASLMEERLAAMKAVHES